MRRENFMIKLSGLILVSFLLQGYVLIASAPSFSSNEDCPKPEHPNPQFYRENWLNLNGRWGFSFDFDLSGVERGWHENGSGFEKEIVVPFCPESELSGIGYTNFMPAVVSQEVHGSRQLGGDKGFLAFRRRGVRLQGLDKWRVGGKASWGNAPFEFEITSALKEGETILSYVPLMIYGRAISHRASRVKSRIVQYFYTRVTGIWQTVWLESRPQQYLSPCG